MTFQCTPCARNIARARILILCILYNYVSLVFKLFLHMSTRNVNVMDTLKVCVDWLYITSSDCHSDFTACMCTALKAGRRFYEASYITMLVRIFPMISYKYIEDIC